MSSNIPFLILFAAIPCLVSSQFCEHLEIIPHPQWCSVFFLCRFGFWTVIVCPAELMFNPGTRRCDFADNVDCINDPSLTTPEWSSSEWTTRTVTWTTPTVPTFSTPTAPTFSTPTAPTFSTPTVPTFSTPDRPTTPSWTTPTRPSIPTRTSKTFCGDSTRPSTLSHLNCEYFYKCIDGIAFEMKCGDGLVWNSHQERCDLPENYTCVNESISQPI